MTLTATPSPVIVSTADMSDIEQSKENIQPMRHGHHVEKLVQALQQQSGTLATTTDDPTSTTRTERLAAERQQCEQQIKSYTGDDPLSPWLDYVKWTMDSYPILQSNDSAILPLLEKLTRKFLPTKQYHNDRRYIQVWLMYANSVKQPLDIYQYMHTNHIGTQLALLYESHSNALLDRHRYSDGQTVLQHGIDCSAQPIKNLRVAMRRLEARQKKYEEAKALKSAEEGHDQLIDNDNTGVQRQHLGTVGGGSRDENAVPAQQPQRGAQRPAPAANNAFRNISQRPPLAQNRPIVSDSKHNFSVFTEDQAEAPDDKKRNGLYIASDATPSSWANLSTQADLSKENTRQTSMWNEPLNSSKLSAEQQNDAAWHYVHANKGVPASAPVDVFVEDELEPATATATSITSDPYATATDTQLAKRGLRTELETTSVRAFTAALEANPLKYLQKTAKTKLVATTSQSGAALKVALAAGSTNQHSQSIASTTTAASVQLRPTSSSTPSIALKPATGALSSQSVTSQLRTLVSKPIAAGAGSSKTSVASSNR